MSELENTLEKFVDLSVKIEAELGNEIQRLTAALAAATKRAGELEARLEDAERVIEHYADKVNWRLQTNFSILAREWASYKENGYDKAREYRRKYQVALNAGREGE